MSDLFISPFHPAYRKPDVWCPVTEYQQKSKELPYIDWQKLSNQYKVESITYNNSGKMVEIKSSLLELLI